MKKMWRLFLKGFVGSIILALGLAPKAFEEAKRSTNLAYSMTMHKKQRDGRGKEILFSEDFEAVPPSIVTSDAMWMQNGFAGCSGRLTTTAEGIRGRSLKAIFDFYEDGGWQKNVLYQATRLGGTQSSSLYEITTSVKFLGSVERADLKLWRKAPVEFFGGVTLRKDGSYEPIDMKKGFAKNVKVRYDEATRVFDLNYRFFGTDGELQFQAFVNSSDPTNANANLDTGLMLDDFKLAKVEPKTIEEETEGEYKNIFRQDFESLTAGTSYLTSDDMYHATCFGGPVNDSGAKREIISDGIKGNSLKITYTFKGDNHNVGPFYLDGNKAGVGELKFYDVYKAEFYVKAFGEPEGAIMAKVGDWAYISSDASLNTVSFDGFLSHKAEVVDEAVHYVVYFYGFGYFGPEFNLNRAMGSTVPTGLIIDDFVISKKIADVPSSAPEILNPSLTFELDSTEPLKVSVDLKGESIAELKIDEMTIDPSKYRVSDGILSLDASAINELAPGDHSLTIKTTSLATASLKVSDVERRIKGTYTPKYSQDFNGVPAGFYDSNGMFEKTGFAGVSFDSKNIEIVDGEDRYLKANLSFFPAEEGGWQKNNLYLDTSRTLAPETDVVYKISYDIAGFGAWERICYGIQLQNDTSALPITYIHLFKDGTYMLDAPNKYFIKENVSYDGAKFHVEVYCQSKGQFIFSLWNQRRTDDNVPTGLILDNFAFAKMDVPELISKSETYDKAVKDNPHYVIDLYGYKIENVAIDGSQLIENVDYFSSDVPGSTKVRLELSESFLSKYNIGDAKEIIIKTTKGNSIKINFTVVDTKPIVPEQTYIDISFNQDVAINVDLKGKNLEKIALNGIDLAGNEYKINSENSVITFKKEYLARLVSGENEFVLISSSGAKSTFKLIISDSTPTISDATFKKGSNADVSFDIYLKGKDLVEVKVDDVLLSSDQYSVSGDKLRIVASVFEACSVGEHIVTIKTTGIASAKVVVSDMVPIVTGEYEVESGKDLIIAVDLQGKDIVEIKINKFVLKADEYSYKDGKLTIKASVLQELSASRHKVIISTSGGSTEVFFELKEAHKGVQDGSFAKNSAGLLVGSAAIGTLVIGGAIAITVLGVKKKRK